MKTIEATILRGITIIISRIGKEKDLIRWDKDLKDLAEELHKK